jgi:predicted metal-dependent hydrolase
MPDFANISPYLEVRISSRARRMALRLDASRRRVCLVIPKRANLKNAYNFALANRDWIEQRVREIPDTVALADGMLIPVLGRQVTISVERHPSIRVTDITLTDTTLLVRTRLDDIEPRIIRFLKKLAAEEFRRIADEKAELIGKKVTKFDLRDMKTRWGSCSTSGHMTLSWRLLFAPFEAYEYVISHEVAHLIHPNHSPRFWKLCKDLSTDFSTGHTWMKRNGSELMRFGNNGA